MKNGITMLNDGAEVINSALGSLDMISNGIGTISESIENLSSKSELLAQDGQAVKNQIVNIVSSSNENMSTTDKISDVVGHTVQALDSLNTSSEDLQSAIEKLGN